MLESLDVYDMTEVYNCVTDTGIVCDGLEQLDILTCTTMCCEVHNSPNPITVPGTMNVKGSLTHAILFWTNIVNESP